MKANYCIHIPMRGLSPLYIEKGLVYFCGVGGLYQLDGRNARQLLPCRPNFIVRESLGFAHDSACNIDRVTPFDGRIYVHVVTPTDSISTSGKGFGHKVICIDPEGNVQWEFSHCDGSAFGGVRPDMNGGCFAISCHSPIGADAIYKLSPGGELAWRKEFPSIRFVGQHHPADCIQILVAETASSGNLTLLNIDTDGTATVISKFSSTLQQILYDAQGNLYTIAAVENRMLRTSYYNFQRYISTGDGTFSLCKTWQCENDFFAAPYAWGVSPNGQYLAAASFDMRGNVCKSNLTRLSLTSTLERKRFTLSCSTLNNVELNIGHYVAPIVLDDGTIFSAWQTRGKNIVVKSTDETEFEIIRKTPRTIIRLQTTLHTLFVSEIAGNNSWVSALNL